MLKLQWTFPGFDLPRYPLIVLLGEYLAAVLRIGWLEDHFRFPQLFHPFGGT
jgi:hypothetical protein